jgi:uncharacterized metal-binding protein YceD (DUF177 family)
MVTIFIQGLQDGTHSIQLQEETSAVEDLFPEYFGELSISGTLKKLGNRYTISLQCLATANFVCDRSGEPFIEQIEASFDATYIADSSLFRSKTDEVSTDQTIVIRDEDKYIDITDLLRDELGVALPLKRLSPQYKEKEFEELFPQLVSKGTEPKTDAEIDDRWAVLQQIKHSKS